MLARLQTLPDGIAETQDLIARLDELFRAGFVGGQPAAALEPVFAGTPLEPLLAESLPSLGRGEFQERHFLALAAARAALQGAQYDTLWAQARAALGRPAMAEDTAVAPRAAPEPLLASLRHWLMELAIAGFARLEPGAVLSVLPALEQLRRQPRLARLAFGLTGFVEELLAAVPVARADELPLLRWCDLWASAMLNAAGAADLETAELASGTLYPLGVELRERAQLASVVFYGLLARGHGMESVRVTRSRFKVGAIGGDATWLLFPEAELLLDALAQGRALDVRDIALLPAGDIIWEPARARLGEKCKLLGVAARYLAPQAAEQALVRRLPPLDRHPVQLAEPVVLPEYAFTNDAIRLPDGTALPLDARWHPDIDITNENLTESAALFGLLRYDAGRWALQPLAAATRAGKLAFAGQAGAKVLKKPPKINPVAILEERASRLLRK